MKGKKFLALASIFAGVALVGTTFAAWAVTDNAGTKHIKVSGGKISADTTTTYVTLDYGTHTALSDVANLEAGTKRFAGKAGLVATYSGATSYDGKLTLAMSTTATGTNKLLDFVKVYCYAAEPTYNSTTKIVSAVPSGANDLLITLDRSHLSGSASITMTSDTEKLVYFVVEMTNSYNNGTADVTIDASILSSIKNDIVDVSVDWDHDETTEQPIAHSTTVYYKPTLGTDDKVYCYAFKGTAANAEYPGLEMTNEGNGLYSYTINTDLYDKFILSYGHGQTNTKARAEDFAVTEVVGTNNFYNGSTWTTKPVADTSLTADYYVVGSMAASSWGCNSAFAMTKDTTVKDDAQADTYKITGVSFAAGDKFKVRNNSNLASEEWYSNTSTWDGCGYTLDGEGNLVVSAAGTYTVQLYRTSNFNNHIVLTKN